MPLVPTFSLTPNSPWFYSGSGHRGNFTVWGADFFTGGRYSFNQQHANDELLFTGYSAADPAVDYSIWNNRRQVRYVELYCDLQDYAPNKELALVFGFDVTYVEARLLVYSSAGQLEDVTLVQGDNQFLMEVESLETPFSLYFIHTNLPSSPYGGGWFFPWDYRLCDIAETAAKIVPPSQL